MFIQLPCEILANIARFMLQIDKLQCSLVCKSWCRPFQESLWKTLEVKTTNKINEICRSPNNQSIYRDNGHLVQTILLGNSICVKEKELLTMQRHFTNLRYLNIPCGGLNRTEFGGTTKWELWRSLTDLRIHIPYIRTGEKKRIMSIIPNLPCLRRLEFEDDGWDNRSLYTFQDLEQIHSYLPRLTCLDMCIKLEPIPMSIMDQIECVSPAIHLTKTMFAIRHVDITWLYYFSVKYPSMDSLRWRIKYHYILPKVDMVKVTEMLSERSCIFPCLKKIDFEEASGLSVPDSVFLNMFSKFPGTIDHFHYTLNGKNVKSLQVSTLSSRFQKNWAASLKSLFFTFPESSFSSSEERISFGMLPVLVNLRVKLLSGYVELDLLLKNCPAMKKLYLEAGKVTFSTIFPQNVSRHGLQEIELDSMEVHSDIYRHISNCCRELSSMRVRNIRMEDTDSSEFKSIYLDMPYTRLKMLNLVRFRLSHQTYDKQCLHYTHLNRIQLLTIEQTGPITRPIDSLPDENNQRNMAATSWFHQYRVNAHPSIERAVWMLGEEETRVAEFYFSSASSGVSQRVEDPNTARDCFGLVDKSSWKDDLLRGYIKLRCKSVAVCNIDGTIFYGGV